MFAFSQALRMFAFSQALEYQRLSEVRASSSALASLNLTSSAGAILCIDLAASECSLPFERVIINL
jgi:hypothetical protein